MFATDLNEYDCNVCDSELRKMRGCLKDLESPYLYPPHWGEIRRCPKLPIISDNKYVHIYNIAHGVNDKLNLSDYANYPNSFIQALDFATEGMNHRKQQEAKNVSE